MTICMLKTKNCLTYSVHIHDKRWKSMFSNRDLSKMAQIIALNLQHCKNNCIALNFVNNKLITNINKQYRKKNKPTNVIALAYFAAEDIMNAEPYMQLGDIFLAFETVKCEAETFAITTKNHAMHLIVHGTLHIFGLDHTDEYNAAKMEETEGAIMEQLGGKNPYTTYMVNVKQ